MDYVRNSTLCSVCVSNLIIQSKFCCCQSPTFRVRIISLKLVAVSAKEENVDSVIHTFLTHTFCRIFLLHSWTAPSLAWTKTNLVWPYFHPVRDWALQIKYLCSTSQNCNSNTPPTKRPLDFQSSTCGSRSPYILSYSMDILREKKSHTHTHTRKFWLQNMKVHFMDKILLSLCKPSVTWIGFLLGVLSQFPCHMLWDSLAETGKIDR